MAERQEKQFETGRETAQNDRIGGTTPGETLALFAAAISIGDGEQAALLSVPAIRDRVRGFVQGISVEDRKAVAMKLKGIADNAPSQVEGMTFQVAAPVNVELIRYPSGAWKVVSF